MWAVVETVVEMVMSAGASQGKHLSSEGHTVETLPVLSGSFIAGCFATGFFWLLAPIFFSLHPLARHIRHDTALQNCSEPSLPP